MLTDVQITVWERVVERPQQTDAFSLLNHSLRGHGLAETESSEPSVRDGSCLSIVGDPDAVLQGEH